jgi:uncharacterized membrane protein
MILEILKYVLGLFMIGVGILHFRNPKPFIKMMPSWLGAHKFLVLLSGFFEILGGVGVMIPWSQRIAAWGLVALFVAVLPANINMAIHKIPLGKKEFPVWALWARLPLQLVLMAWAYAYT